MLGPDALGAAVDWGLARVWPLALLMPTAKYLATLITTTAIGFATYALFLRHTPIGALLNGPRKRPSAAQTIGRY